MPRLAVFVAALALASPLAGVWATAADAGSVSQPTRFLSWPGKSGAVAADPTSSTPLSEAPASTVALSKQFFAGGDSDMAAPPPPLMPRPVPGTQAVTSTASANTASNRARQNEILTADSAAEGPAAGVANSN